MKLEELETILSEKITIYRNKIALELERSHNYLFEDFGFPRYGITSNFYHEQVYYQSYLESYTRKMINSILKRISDYESADEIVWPELEYYGIYNGYTNTEYEQEFGFELINVDRKIGYRYTTVKSDELDHIFDNKNIDEIKIVEWIEEEDSIYYSYEDKRIHVITVAELFRDLFEEISEDEFELLYNCFNKKISEAIEEAMQMISLTTLPGFTPYYLHKFRDIIITDLKNEVNLLSTFIVYNNNYKKNESNSKSLIDLYHIDKIFMQKKLYGALVGTNSYAKSFLTSEYLYHYFRNNPMFDFTPIVSGYIKSIEQLLYAICTSYRNYKHYYIDMGNWTMGNYEKYLSENEEILRTDFRPAKEVIINCLESYRIESRNHLFHRNYLNRWDRVEIIRKNTIFLYVTLLSMLDETLMNVSTKLLCFLDESYDHLFKAVDKDKSSYYEIRINEKIFTIMKKQYRDEGIAYNWNGQIKTPIKFKKFIHGHYDELELSSTNMPSEIWSTDYLGKKIKLIWKANT